MPSTLASTYYPHDERHLLPQLREFKWDWNTVKSRIGVLEDLPKSAIDTSQCPSTSPLMKMDGHPAHDSAYAVGQHVLPPAVSSNGRTYPTPHSHSRQGSNGKPFYQSYYSARQNQSPPIKKEVITDRGESGRRKASADGNAIASYLQIPSSINDSKGSLPEFAAQVR